ncbi:MAG: hypothetical protein ACREFN_19030 [Acetobacteraceae bacterium]
MKYFWAFDINENLVDALRIWSEYLVGERRSGEWGVAVAAYYLQTEGFGLPERPIETETLRKLDGLARSADDLRPLAGKSNWGPRDTKRMTAFDNVMAEVSKNFFETELDITLEFSNPSLDPAQKSDAISAPTNNLSDIAEVTANTYENPGDLLDAAGQNLASLYNSVPPEAANDYSKVPKELTANTVSKSEYDIVGRDLTGQEGADYFRPPPPETQFEAWRDAGGGT